MRRSGLVWIRVKPISTLFQTENAAPVAETATEVSWRAVHEVTGPQFGAFPHGSTLRSYSTPQFINIMISFMGFTTFYRLL
jgi:hypothetical protein